MHRSSVFNLFNMHLRHYIMQHHEQLRGWAIMSALHVLNVDAKLMRRDTYYVYKAKNITGKSMTERDFTWNRLTNQVIYQNILVLLVATTPPEVMLNTSYRDKLPSLGDEDFRIFVRSVMRTIAEYEADWGDVTVSNSTYHQT